MRLAHLILAHDHKSQLERLIKRLIYTNTDIYIHLDKKKEISEFLYLESLTNVFFITHRTAINWGDYSMVTATLDSFEEILKTGRVYSHINLLSGVDYPLKSAGDIQDFLFANASKTFMRYRHIDREWQESKSRFTKYSLGDYHIPFKFQLQQLMNRLLPARELPNNLEPYGFSQWITITPECISYTLDYLKKNNAVRRFFKMTWGVDELVFQTILLNSDLKDKIINDHLRYIRFDKGGSRPKTLTILDKKALIDSGKFYARKFSEKEDSKILDELDLLALT